MPDKLRPRGRPRRSADAATVNITVRVTETERDAAAHAAQTKGVTLSDYVRALVARAARRAR